MTSDLLNRFSTAAVLIFLLFLLFISNINMLFIFTIYLICTYCYFEWISFTSTPFYSLGLFVILMIFINYTNVIDMKYFSIITLAIWVGLIMFMLFAKDMLAKYITKYSNFLGIFIILTFFLHFINFYPYSNNSLSVSNIVDHKNYIILFIILLSCIDIFAYFSGKFFGKHKITSKISPNKTLEGYIGGYLFTMIIFIFLYNYYDIVWTSLDLVFLSSLILLAFSGDLFMSFVKRIYNIKDTGNILPGHGGLLDRLDSYFPSLPLFFIWIML